MLVCYQHRRRGRRAETTTSSSSSITARARSVCEESGGRYSRRRRPQYPWRPLVIGRLSKGVRRGRRVWSDVGVSNHHRRVHNRRLHHQRRRRRWGRCPQQSSLFRIIDDLVDNDGRSNKVPHVVKQTLKQYPTTFVPSTVLPPVTALPSPCKPITLPSLSPLKQTFFPVKQPGFTMKQTLLPVKRSGEPLNLSIASLKAPSTHLKPSRSLPISGPLLKVSKPQPPLAQPSKIYLPRMILRLILIALLATVAGCARDDRLRHGNRLGDELTLSLKGLEEAVACPNCLYKHHTGKTDEGGGHGTRAGQPAADNLRLEAIKRQILSKLGLRHKPNVTLAAFPREIIMETLFRAEDGVTHEHDAQINTNQEPTTHDANQDTVDVDDFYGRTSEIISFAEQGVRVNGNRLVEFRVSAESSGAAGGQELRVRTATLWLKADVRHTRTPTKCRTAELYVFKFLADLPRSVKINSKEFSELTEDPIAVQLDESATGWQKVDVTRIVRQWLETHAHGPADLTDRLRLFVDCACCSNWQVRLFNNVDAAAQHSSATDGSSHTDRTAHTADPDRPFLVIHTDPSTAKRVRRRALDCGADSGNACCKQRFYVSFKELGWDDWIIAPQGYYANYCRGDCGHHRAPDAYATYHKHVIEEVRKTHHLSGMQPCCAPLKFSSMSLIYFGPDSNIIKRDLPKMVVDECGCP